jgi:FdhD protein
MRVDEANDPLANVRVTSLPAGGAACSEADVLAVEAPLEVRIGGKPVTVLMRTPDFDGELVTGFLFCEGVIADADDILSIERPAGVRLRERRGRSRAGSGR